VRWLVTTNAVDNHIAPAKDGRVVADHKLVCKCYTIVTSAKCMAEKGFSYVLPKLGNKKKVALRPPCDKLV
jgi:hypothetical protein